MSSMIDIALKLRTEGYKVTPQRIAIYNAINHKHEHPSAEMIYQSLRSEYPTMSLATVYKTMEIFEKIGLVRVLDMGDDCSRYDWDVEPHPHIRCICCNKVEDLTGVDLNAIREKIESDSDYQLTGQQLSFEGICPKCLRKGAH